MMIIEDQKTIEDDQESESLQEDTVKEVTVENPFPVVGIGASAGGLEALEVFFTNMPANTGLAFVVVQHLSPDYKSLMAELLSKHTTMSVHEAHDSMVVKPNNVYLIPRKKNMTIFHYRLHLTDRGLEQGLNLPIDIFLKSLAEDLGEKAIAIILSGTGSDGTRGIRAVKEQGGMVMAQDELTAKFDGMPRSAIATQLVDYVLAPEEMGRELINYVQHPCLTHDPSLKLTIPTDDETFNKIFAVLRSRSGVDFSYYKQSTMVRRIERRMSINQIQDLAEYLAYLYRAPGEIDTLYKELLIGVTRFFRDEEAFEFLRQNVLLKIFEDKTHGKQIRVWVAGCSTGEEAYSIAILLREQMESSGKFVDVKVFATDIDQDALEFASRGVYPERIAADVSWDRLKKYFIRRGDSYEIQRPIREMVIFARQNLIKDPPFSKIDLVTCRNLLIYLQPILQKKVMAVFQFALKQDGFLFLGNSETVGSDFDTFVSQHNKWKIYQYRGDFRPSLNDAVKMTVQPDHNEQSDLSFRYATGRMDPRRRVHETIYRNLIEAFMPTCVVVNQEAELLHAFGAIDQYLKVPTGGAFSSNILKMVRQDLSIALSTAIHKVLKDQHEVVYKNMTLQDRTGISTIDMVAKPFTEQNSRQNLVFIQFTPVKHVDSDDPTELELYNIDQKVNQRLADLEQELQYTKENLQATIEELETSNEELQATNEELLAANEELQSTNEELQSVNEELITVNAEFQAKIIELTELNNDMNNLLKSTDVGTIFLDNELRVRKFTAAIQQDINLMELDIGRPLSHISHTFQDCDLVGEAQQVLDTLISQEREIQSEKGKWYLMKIHPYRTVDNVIRGIVITLVDITRLKAAETTRQEAKMALHESETRYQFLSEITFEGILIVEDGRIIDANRAFLDMFGYKSTEVIGYRPLNFVTPTSQNIIRDHAKTGSTKPYQIMALGKDGTTFPAQVQEKSITTKDGRHIWVTAIRDMGDWQQQEYYRTLAHNVPNGAVWLFDQEFRYILVEGLGLADMGLSKETLEGKTIWQIFSSDVSLTLEKSYKATLAGEFTSFELIYKDHKFLIRTVPIQDEQGDITIGMALAQKTN